MSGIKKLTLKQKKLIIIITAAVVCVSLGLGFGLNALLNNKSEKSDDTLLTQNLNDSTETPSTQGTNNSSDTPASNETPENPETPEPPEEQYTEAEYKVMCGEKLEEVLLSSYNNKYQYDINDLTKIIPNLADGKVYFNANYTRSNEINFFIADFGSVLFGAKTYKEMYDNLSDIDGSTITYERQACISNSIGEEKTTELNNYILDKVGIDKNN